VEELLARDAPRRRLVLGQGFHAFDLVCYVIGVALGVGLELIVRQRHTALTERESVSAGL